LLPSELSSKTTAVEASKQANAAFNMAIRALDSVKRDEADATVVAGFNDQLHLNASLACLDASIAAVLVGKSTVLAKTLLAG
jgi:glutamate-1-semialdehyde aminotransferase